MHCGVFGVCLLLQKFALPYISGIPGYLLMLVAVMPLYFSPSFAAANFAVITIIASELVAAMERLHIPKQITIPMVVMIHFFPTMMEEGNAQGSRAVRREKNQIARSEA